MACSTNDPNKTIMLAHCLGYGATLLIHEATFEADMAQDALKKRHSTTDEALKVGEDMQV